MQTTRFKPGLQLFTQEPRSAIEMEGPNRLNLQQWKRRPFLLSPAKTKTKVLRGKSLPPAYSPKANPSRESGARWKSVFTNQARMPLVL
jgi:hypothetical protein